MIAKQDTIAPTLHRVSARAAVLAALAAALSLPLALPAAGAQGLNQDQPIAAPVQIAVSRSAETAEDVTGEASTQHQTAREASSTETASMEDREFRRGWQAYQRGAFWEAHEAWVPLAEAGHARAQYNLGVLYADGRGVERDMTRALAWWTQAADNNHLRAMHNIALARISGFDGPSGSQIGPDYQAALVWLEKAAAAGLANSQYTLGKMYQYGLGVEQDDERAAQLFLAAAEQDFAKAQYNLGKAYRDGTGVEESDAQSIDWFARAARNGHPRAQNRYGTRLAKGDGVTQDEIEALKWFLLASEAGEPRAKRNRDMLMPRMSEADIAEAEARAARWKAARGDGATQ